MMSTADVRPTVIVRVDISAILTLRSGIHSALPHGFSVSTYKGLQEYTCRVTVSIYYKVHIATTISNSIIILLCTVLILR